MRVQGEESFSVSVSRGKKNSTVHWHSKGGARLTGDSINKLSQLHWGFFLHFVESEFSLKLPQINLWHEIEDSRVILLVEWNVNCQHSSGRCKYPLHYKQGLLWPWTLISHSFGDSHTSSGSLCLGTTILYLCIFFSLSYRRALGWLDC